MLRITSRVSALCIASLLAGGPAAAAPVLFTDVGQSTTVLYAGTNSGANLGGTVTYALSSWGTQFATFAITVDNTSTGAGNNLMSGFGIESVMPGLVGVADTSGTWQTAMNASFNGGGPMDFCARIQTGCSGAAAGQGLLVTDPLVSFSITMDFGPNGLAGDAIAFDNFLARFTQVGTAGAAVIIAGTASPTGAAEINGVSEPGSMALVGLALLGIAASRRR